jgi:hypothetical protein
MKTMAHNRIAFAVVGIALLAALLAIESDVSASTADDRAQAAESAVNAERNGSNAAAGDAVRTAQHPLLVPGGHGRGLPLLRSPRGLALCRAKTPPHCPGVRPSGGVSGKAGEALQGTAIGEAGGIRYAVTDLTDAAAALGVVQGEARKINEAGVIAGFEVLEPFIDRSLYWKADGTVFLPPGLPGDNCNRNWDVGVLGTGVGVSSYVWFEQVGGWTRLHMDEKAVIWNHGQVYDLNQIVTGGDVLDLYVATSMSDSGKVIGYGAPPGHEPPPWWPNGFLLDNDGTVTDLGLLHNPKAINNNGVIAGDSIAVGTHACVWENGVATDLHDHPSIQGTTSEAWDINDAGIVVGMAQFDLSKWEEPCAWYNNEPIPLLPDIDKGFGVALAVNGSNQIVGYVANYSLPVPAWQGFLWENGKWIDLNRFLPSHQGWTEIYPFDINDSGQIVGLGIKNGVNARAILMTPL